MKKGNKGMIAVIIVILFVIVASNYWGGFRFFLGMTFVHNIDHYEYSTRHGAFQDDEFLMKGRTLSNVEERYKNFLENNPGTPDTILYRIFKKPFWQFWNWNDYIFNRRYEYPYLDPDMIQ